MGHHSLSIPFQGQHPDLENPPRLDRKSAFAAQEERKPGIEKGGKKKVSPRGEPCNWPKVEEEGSVIRDIWQRMRVNWSGIPEPHEGQPLVIPPPMLSIQVSH